ncbi:hypothetical protein F4778DRAFT_734289 [Xylariomycetidae sp. FL2044]|nr:hypothetical protein F4778DRAFT_734289 [Xylariomycetidae sp. FL2044]
MHLSVISLILAAGATTFFTSSYVSAAESLACYSLEASSSGWPYPDSDATVRACKAGGGRECDFKVNGDSYKCCSCFDDVDKFKKTCDDNMKESSDNQISEGWQKAGSGASC